MGWDDYPDHWDKLRQKVLSRDGNRCTECGATAQEEVLHVHHITPIAEGGRHSMSNLTTLCHPCHEDVHGHRIPMPHEDSGGREEGKKIAVPPCPSGGRAYKCTRCDRYLSLEKQRYLRCPFCGHRVVLKERPGGITEVEVK
jgi:DNA-directed RNA polymerase subunit RPC12/RpoP